MFQPQFHVSWQFETLDMLFHFTAGYNRIQILVIMNKLVKFLSY